MSWESWVFPLQYWDFLCLKSNFPHLKSELSAFFDGFLTFFNGFPLSPTAFQFSSMAFQFSSMAFHFPRNPRKSIYGEKYTKDCYSSFVAAGFDQMWPKMCPSLEDFIMQRTLTKCGPKCAPHQRTLSRSGLWPNVVRNVPLVGGLCHAADFDQMWSKHVPFDGWLRFAMGFDQI